MRPADLKRHAGRCPYRLLFVDVDGTIGCADSPETPVQGAVSALRQVSAESICRLVVISNGDTVTQSQRLQQWGMGDIFDFILCPDSTGFRKPDPRIYRLAMSYYPRIPVTQIVMVGDSLFKDIAPARQLGLGALWYNPTNRPFTGERRPTVTVKNWFEILNFLGFKESIIG